MKALWIASVLAAFLAGAAVNGWQRDSVELSAENAIKVAQDAADKRGLEQAEALDAWLVKNAKNEKVIIRESVKLVDRPVYRNVCLDPDGLRLANAAKNGTAIELAAPVQRTGGHQGD